ncbi:hypothetical protein [Paracoccus salsus]|uniref:hypothetical protein n=1 Tax=Paracoccus salsus TaxID=2911061 RepID=UPI001F3A8BC7|nr:hypothetical protein [Paracoccus salsus]MCF3973231.1 hypothetical protein [Paracoccus salsus]
MTRKASGDQSKPGLAPPPPSHDERSIPTGRQGWIAPIMRAQATAPWGEQPTRRDAMACDS